MKRWLWLSLQLVRVLLSFCVALAGLCMGVAVLVLMPMWFFDLLTVGISRPPVVTWLREVVTLHYSLADVVAAFPGQWPALWEHIGFTWGMMAVFTACGLGMAVFTFPIIALFSCRCDHASQAKVKE